MDYLVLQVCSAVSLITNREMLGKFVFAYIEDIFIYPPSLEEHVYHDKKVLSCLLENQLHVKAEECEFHITQISFLRYIISTEGFTMDKDRVTDVTNFHSPITVKELQRFLDFAIFYCCFVRRFSSIATPLTDLLKKSQKKLLWNYAAEEAFSRLKHTSMTALILKQPDPIKPSRAGAVLSWHFGKRCKLYPVAFYFKKLTSPKRNDDIGNCELLAVKFALEKWCQQLKGAVYPFTIFVTQSCDLSCLPHSL